jgi:hypothetical protein
MRVVGWSRERVQGMGECSYLWAERDRVVRSVLLERRSWGCSQLRVRILGKGGRGKGGAVDFLGRRAVEEW